MSRVRTAVVDDSGSLAAGPCDPRTRVMRSPPGERPSWELWLREPLPGLRDLIVGLWAGDADADSAHHRTVPDGELALMFNLGPPQRVIAPDGTTQVQRAAFVSGLQEQPLGFASMIRHPRVVAVRFRPRGAWAFFGGMPLDALANRVFDLDAVMGAVGGVEPFRQRLIAAVDLGAALDLLEDWIATRLLVGPRTHPMTRAAWDRLRAGAGDVRIATLARDLGVSPRYLNDLFHREVGLSAKGVARILRFEHAMGRLAAACDLEVPEVALACGYYDQAHLDRDFRDLAGLTPTEYRARVFQTPGWREIRG